MEATLRASALSFFESIVMGVAGSAPGFSIATTTAVLIGTAGPASVNALLVFALPMLGIALAYRGLGRSDPRAGAAYDWVGAIFGRLPGFVCGWAVLVSTLVFMVSGSLTLGSNILDVLGLPSNDLPLTTAVGAVCYVAIGLVLIAGIGITSRVQVVLTSLELAIMAVIAAAAYRHGFLHGAIDPPSLAWLGFHYTPSSFAATALVVVFFYWGWDVTSNLGEETHGAERGVAAAGGVISVFLIIGIFVAYLAAARILFTPKDAQGFTVNIVYEIARAAGLGSLGAKLASFAVVLSSVATLETSMLQFSRSLFSMGRDRAMPASMGTVDPRTRTPVRAMVLLIVLGLALIVAASFVRTLNTIIADSVSAVGVQVCVYYGLAGLACAWVHRRPAEGAGTWVAYALVPFLSAIALFALGLYAITTFDVLTRIVGIGGLLVGIVFFKPRGWGVRRGAVAAPT